MDAQKNLEAIQWVKIELIYLGNNLSQIISFSNFCEVNI